MSSKALIPLGLIAAAGVMGSMVPGGQAARRKDEHATIEIVHRDDPGEDAGAFEDAWMVQLSVPDSLAGGGVYSEVSWWPELEDGRDHAARTANWLASMGIPFKLVGRAAKGVKRRRV
jgi:hypothetical protein